MDIEKFCTLFLTSISRTKLYGTEHNFTKKSANEFLKIFEREAGIKGKVEMIISDEIVTFNGIQIQLALGSPHTLSKKLSERGIGFLEMRAGLGMEEFLDFCRQLAGGQKERVKNSKNISLGLSRVSPKSFNEQLEAIRVMETLGEKEEELKDEIREMEILHKHMKEHMEVKVQNFEQIALLFLKKFSRQSNLFLNLANIKQHHKYTFFHSANVTNIVIGMGIALGLDKKEVFQMGLSALLHDVGKMFIPSEILNKKEKLTAGEWEVIKSHPYEGARFLLKQKNMGNLPVVVAFEHHIHYTGLGGYPTCKPPRKPCNASQLVSIADCFDALFSIRSYHEKYDILSALEIIQDSAGSIYNPWLVDLFSKYITLNIECL